MRHELLSTIVRMYGTPVYVYDKRTIETKYCMLDSSIMYSPKKIYYACKANSNLSILKVLKELGCFADVVSAGELFLALKAGFDPSEILFTGNNLTGSEMEYAVCHNVLVTLDSLSQLETYGKINPHSDICVRINPNLGAGHHKHVITGGLQSKFGIHYTDVNRIQERADHYHLRVVGVHMHMGSGVLNPLLMLKGAASLLEVASHFDDIEFVDIGGGLGIPYGGEDPFDLNVFGTGLTALFDTWAGQHRKVTLVLEPGRFLVAESGVLLTQVTAVNRNPKYTFVGVDTGFNHFMRPVLYDAYHHIQVVKESGERKSGTQKELRKIEKESEKKENEKGSEIKSTGKECKTLEKVTVCGNICESGDIFARNRELPPLKVGNILAIEHVGAYGFSMASQYNSRVLPAEVLVDGDTITLIRRRGTYEDLLLNQVHEVGNHE